jgi:hypothetical protein
VCWDSRVKEDSGGEEGEEDHAGAEQDGSDIAAVEMGRIATPDDFVHSGMRPVS